MCIIEDATGVTLSIHVKPNATSNEIGGIWQSADNKAYLQVFLRARPEDGKANKMLIDFLAKLFSIPRSCITLQSGSRSRYKRIRILTKSDDLRRFITQAFRDDSEQKKR